MERSRAATGRQAERGGRGAWWRDALLAAVLLALGLGSLRWLERSRLGGPFGGPPEGAPIDALAVVLVVLAALAIAVRRRWPEATVVVSVGSAAAYLAIGYPYGPILLSAAIAVYTIARHRRLGIALAWCGAALAALLVHLLTNPASLDGAFGLLPATGWVVVPATIGIARRQVFEARARTRAEADRRLLDDERLRIAHEVHDVVGHGLAAIQLQADIALHLRDAKPQQALEALTMISRASSEALDELRATIAGMQPADGASRTPTPGLARLDELVERMRAAGIEIDLETVGAPRPLPSAIDLAAYRIVQESLTNVAKHSAAPSASVRIEHAAGRIRITVVNRAGETGEPGFGIEGMRRRATQLGGALEAGPTGAGTFRVRAELPLPRGEGEDA
ncbi:sensor histidine kinase [Agrococcus baldri]|uniref:sensor histidine kinase n=1 Tax=Agrococcus baldri TaxID=153730 RepID=UPI001649D2BA|nr:sensor histidine kinase [Agrococcus baldri]